MLIKIINSAEGESIVYKEVTKEQYEFLLEIESDLIDAADNWAPSFTVFKLKD